MNRMRARRLLHENAELKERVALVSEPGECSKCKELEAEIELLTANLKEANKKKYSKSYKKDDE